MIGEEHDQALLCLTDFYQFFNESDNTRNIGRWYFFNESNELNVSTDINYTIYMSSDPGVVRLHRKNTGNNSPPIGRLWCEILDSNNISQRIYVRVYYNENMSINSSSLASDPDSSHTGTEPRYEDSSSPIDSSSPTESSSPMTSCCITAEADSKVSAAVIGGAGAGGLLLIVTITVGVILVVLIKR